MTSLSFSYLVHFLAAEVFSVIFACDLRAFRIVMKLPDDTLLDLLQFLDRPNLDVIQISTKRFDDLVGNRLAQVCLRRLKSATNARPIYTSLFGKLQLTIRGPPDKSMLSPEEQAGKNFADLIVSSYVERLHFDDLDLNDRLLAQMKASLTRSTR